MKNEKNKNFFSKVRKKNSFSEKLKKKKIKKKKIIFKKT